MKPNPQEIVEFVEGRFREYVGSQFFQNWRLQCENIRDALDQRWRTGEQMTRSGFYFASLRATRDGFREGFVDTFGQAKPLFLYKPRRGTPQEMATRAQEVMEDIWEDCEGLMAWLGLCDDAVDYGMAVAYTSWCRYYDEAEAPVVKKEAWGDALQWEDAFDILLNRPDVGRIHPFNYRGDPRQGHRLSWEGCEWEWTLDHLMDLRGNDLYDQKAVERLIDKMAKGQIGGGSDSYHNSHDALGGQKPSGPRIYPKEYWGDLRGVRGLERDSHEYTLIVCEGEILRFNVNRFRGKNSWRPFKRVRLSPMQDLPIGYHLLAPNLPHSKIKNLMVNLGIDDVIMRQHLGLAVWPNALKNPNDLLNPEGARGVLFMKDGVNPNFLPKFYADGRSGVLQDAFAMDDRIERDAQMSGIPNSALGLTGGGMQNDTATGQRFLASNANRKSRAAIMWSVETGLKPIGKDLMLLTLRNRPPEDLQMSPQELAELWANNKWEAADAVTADQVEANMALANWGQVAMQTMTQLTTQNGSADHVIAYLKDLARTMRISTSRVDDYFKVSTPPQVSTGTPASPQGAPMQPNAAAVAQGPAQAPMAFEAEPEVMGA